MSQSNAFKQSAEALSKVKDLVIDGKDVYRQFDKTMAIFNKKINAFEKQQDKALKSHEDLMHKMGSQHEGLMNQQQAIFDRIQSEQQSFRSDITNLRSEVMRLTAENHAANKVHQQNTRQWRMFELLIWIAGFGYIALELLPK